MTDAAQTDLLIDLLRALADADVEHGLASALTHLEALGICRADDEEACWLRVGDGRHSVALAARAQVDESLRETLTAVLQVALARLADRDELRRALERAQMLSEASFEGIFIHENGVIIDANERVAELLRCTPAEVLGPRTMLECVAPEDLPGVLKRMAERVEGEYTITGIRKDGARFPAELLVKQGKLGDRPVRVTAVRDVTERERTAARLRESEQRMAQAQRLDSLGVLAGGIAHDFNNLLLGVLGNAELLRARLTASNDQRAIEAIIRAAQRASNLTAQMLAYAGARELGEKQPIALDALLHELRTLLEASLSKKAAVTVEIAPDCIVHAERVTLTQVLMNLLTNASDALDDRPGTIHVSAHRVREPDARFTHAMGAAIGIGDWVLLEVQDDGVGMDESVRGRIFEPFFTTKPHGHGLGLAACLGIVAAHGGAIVVESELGRGTCFALLLPAAQRRSTALELPTSAPAQRPRCVLIIDDESLVRAFLRELLEQHGHTVLEASGGEAGLRLAESHPVDVVVLDMTMPDLDGIRVVNRLRARGSRVPVILCSGNLDASFGEALATSSIQLRLQKPFSGAALLSAIERVCGGADQRAD